MLNKNFAKAGLAGLVLAVSGLGVAQQKAELAQADLWMQPAKGGFSVEFVSSGEIVGLQFDIKGVQVADGQFDCGIGLASSHTASCSITADGNLRVIVFSMENAPIPDGTMVMVRNAVSADRNNLLGAVRKGSEAALDRVVFADIQGANVTPAHLQ